MYEKKPKSKKGTLYCYLGLAPNSHGGLQQAGLASAIH